MKLAVSACLLGVNCKYNGKNNYRDDFLKELEKHDILPICPETVAGLPCPRVPAEIRSGKVYTRDGKDITYEFEEGARRTLEQIREFNPDLVILKSKSPSCGVGMIYDGSFSSKLTEGNGILAQKLIEESIPVIAME